MAQWFYRDPHGKEMGPFGGTRLLELIRIGDVQAHTEIRKDDSNWTLACEVNGLWQAVARPSVTFHCPHCNTMIEKPPSTCTSCKKEVKKAVGQLVHHSRPRDTKHRWDKSQQTQSQPKAPPLQ